MIKNFLTGDTYFIAQALFLKFLAIIYLIAFTSLLVQLKGLWGSHGILSIKETVAKIRKQFQGNSYKYYPSLFLFSQSDTFLKFIAISGIVSSLGAFSGYLSPFFFLICWACYLSFVNVGEDFLAFQWDILLLETGFIAIFFSFLSPPPLLFVLLIWLLLFRLVFSSGIDKVLRGSDDWRDLTAMKYHYETQPLPTRLAYYFHQQPLWFAKLSTFTVYLFEICVPLLIFSPTPVRTIICLLLIAFQVMIMLTGNYAFFNLLTIALCIPLIPDAMWGNLFTLDIPLVAPSPMLSLLISLVAIFLLTINVLFIIKLFTPFPFFNKILRFIAPFHLINSYGLFVHMTQIRDEIQVEGSYDGVKWETYRFKWKPGIQKFPPKLVAPHQPRLDWQMWFAALSSYRFHPWFINFLIKLLQGSKDVAALLDYNPFQENPPKFIRATRYNYTFTDLKTREETGNWWNKTYKGMYCPPLSLDKDLS